MRRAMKTKINSRVGKECVAWVRLLAVALIGCVGFLLLLHDLDVNATGWSWGYSLVGRLVGAGIMYVAYLAFRVLAECDMLPKMFMENDDD